MDGNGEKTKNRARQLMYKDDELWLDMGQFVEFVYIYVCVRVNGWKWRSLCEYMMARKCARGMGGSELNM